MTRLAAAGPRALCALAAPTEMNRRVVVVHAGAAGRTRLQAACLIGDAALAERVQAAARGLPDVEAVRVNPWTGSIIVRHRPSVSREGLRGAVQAVLAGVPVAGMAASRAAERQVAQADTQAPPAEPAGPSLTGDWHAQPVDAVFRALETRETGLSGDDYRQRFAARGPNAVPPQRARAPGVVFAQQFQSLPVGLLAGSAVLSVATGGLLDAAVTVAVLLLNGGIGFGTEYHTEQVVARLSQPVDPAVTVVRDGQVVRVRGGTLVPGDIVHLARGDAVAADARVIDTDGLSLDESVLTGESVPVSKSPADLTDGELQIADLRNMVFRGTVVTGGSGRAVVVATGRETAVENVRRLVGTTRPPRPQIERRLDELGRALVLVCLGASGIVMAGGLWRGYGRLAAIRSAVALAVSTIPEGLPAIATTSLALSAQSMRRHRALVRSLPAIETTGAINVLCLDKTGTLTMNRMRVTALIAGGERYEVDGGILRSEGGGPCEADLAVQRLVEAVVLCNDCTIDDDGEIDGSATEAALFSLRDLLPSAAFDETVRAERETVLRRNHRRNYMATRHTVTDGSRVTVKGSPDEVLGLCETILVDGHAEPLDDAARRRVLAHNAALAARGLRVLGVADGPGGAVAGECVSGLCWLGLAGLRDPVRNGVREVIAAFHRAGIRTVMITGDQAATAQAVAQELGLAGGGAVEVLEAGAVRNVSREVLAALADRASVFARVNPTDKLLIVQALQSRGHVVAMTGDGVNDGPALRAADSGIAIGTGGTDVAREIADIVIEGEDLDSLAHVLAQGRATGDNIRHAVHFLLATNLSEALMMAVEALHGPNELETPMELFWLNLVTDVFPALGLALAPPAPGVLDRPPTDVQRPLLSREDALRLVRDGSVVAAPALLSHFIALSRYGPGPQTRAMGFAALASAQLLHAFALRPGAHARRPTGLFADRGLDGALAISFALLAAAFLVPGLRRLLGIAPLSGRDAALALGLSVLPLAAGELRRRTAGRHARQPGHTGG